MGEESICWVQTVWEEEIEVTENTDKVKETAADMLKKLQKEENTYENLQQLMVLDGGGGRHGEQGERRALSVRKADSGLKRTRQS